MSEITKNDFLIREYLRQNRLVLAPMAGVTNESFRSICRGQGAGIVYTEMISDKGLLYQNERTMSMIQNDEVTKPVGLQVFGSDPESIRDAVLIALKEFNYDFVDINMGCPVPKVVKSGCGSALLLNPQKIKEIITCLAESIELPITIKIRAGWDKEHINCGEIAMLASEAGVAAIAIHGRTRSSMYTGEANLDYIRMVRENADCVVIGNGDVTSVLKARQMLETGVDGVMIGRGSLGNPWIFKEINAGLNGYEFIEPTASEILETMLEHAQKLMSLSSERVAILQMRTHAAWYFRKLPFSKQFRSFVVNVSTYSDLEQLAKTYLKMYPDT